MCQYSITVLFKSFVSPDPFGSIQTCLLYPTTLFVCVKMLSLPACEEWQPRLHPPQLLSTVCLDDGKGNGGSDWPMRQCSCASGLWGNARVLLAYEAMLVCFWPRRPCLCASCYPLPTHWTLCFGAHWQTSLLESKQALFKGHVFLFHARFSGSPGNWCVDNLRLLHVLNRFWWLRLSSIS